MLVRQLAVYVFQVIPRLPQILHQVAAQVVVVDVGALALVVGCIDAGDVGEMPLIGFQVCRLAKVGDGAHHLASHPSLCEWLGLVINDYFKVIDTKAQGNVL